LLDRLQSTGFETIPADSEWLPGVATVVDAARLLDHPILEQAMEVARPYAERFAVEGIGGALHGSIGRLVADALVALGRNDEAVPYARRALESNRAAGALLAAHAQRTLASALGDTPEARELAAAANATYEGLGLPHLVRANEARSEPPTAGRDGELRRDGDVWHVAFGGSSTIVKHSKGMHDLALLLGRPGRDVHVTELEALPPEVAAAARGSARDEALDRQAVAAYRSRLAELDDDLADAEAANDIVRAERTRSERDFLLDELSSSIGLGGRARAAGPDPVERLRKAVTARVRDTIRRIDAVHPELGRHLSNSIRTGTYCSYHPEQPVVWHCESRSGARWA
jgi:tetratricopeptide (TPR) repeat protein